MGPKLLPTLAFVLLSLGCSDAGESEPTAPGRIQLGLAAGAACTSGSQCDSTFCVDGVCCTTDCTGLCTACAAPMKQSLSASGTCGPALAGFDPHNDCDADPVATCGDTGSCNGLGACALYPQGTSCKTLPAQTNVCVIQGSKGQICSGTGVCYNETSPPGVPCAPYQCKNGACAFPCINDSDCQPPNRCEAGVCKPKRPNGAPCSVLGECASGNCTDGVCCNSSCGGQCQACNLPASLGVCSTVSGEPVPPRLPCAGTPPCQGTCAGQPDQCSFPASATECGSASCTGDVSTSAATCDGTGACAPGSSQPCNPYGCDPATGSCRTDCVSNAECSAGASCDTGTSKCAVTLASCKDAFTVLLPNGTSQACAPYKCVGGKCQQQCTTTGDCAPDYVCEGNACVPAPEDSGIPVVDAGSDAGTGATGGTPPPPADPDSAGGCGCRAAGAKDRGIWLLVLALAALGVRRSRRC